MLRDQIDRTSCHCEHCQVGCKTMPAMCALGDVERIVDHLDRRGLGDGILSDGVRGYPIDEWIARHFVASEGAKVAKIERCGSSSTFNIPTITPAQKPNGECVFYDQGRCTIHAVSPGGCALVDSHMDRQEGNAIVGAMLAEICEDKAARGPYFSLWQSLANAGRLARPRAERRDAFEEQFAQLGPCPQNPPPQSLDA